MIVAIVGVGLIGGSIGLGLIESGFAELVIGYDPSEDSLKTAVDHKCIQVAVNSLDEASLADLWIVAVPPSAMAATLQQIAVVAKPTAVITDTASVKKHVLADVPESIATRFVGGHPMAGREHRGVFFARAGLFEKCSWVLCPTDRTEHDAIRWAQRMVYALDAKPVVMTPEAHDAHIAVLSHLPHAVANALVLQGSELPRLDIHGGSWSDLTRVAGSNPELWNDIFSMNREATAAAIEGLVGRLERFRECLLSNDPSAILAALEDAAQARVKQVARELRAGNAE